MRKLIVFNQVSLDGFFVDMKGDMSWAHKDDAEWLEFVSGNASGGGELIFGRTTYEMMSAYWPTRQARESNPVVAGQMNQLPKVVFSRTMRNAAWNNTRLMKGDVASKMRQLKKESGQDMVIFGSGSIISPLAQAGLIDEFQIVVNPILLGEGKSMFGGIKGKLHLKLTKTRVFSNGNVLLCYKPASAKKNRTSRRT